MGAMLNLQKKKFPKLYNYKGEYLCELSEALNVSESQRLGELGTLNFEYPTLLVDIYNNSVLDSLGNPMVNPKVAFIENDIRCLFDGRWYVIKINEDIRDDSNKRLINCSCYDIAYNLQELMVEYLNLTPPIALAVNATTAISQVLESAQQVRDSKVVSSVTNTITLDTLAHPTDGAYVGYKIKILSGTGVGQERTITAYNGTTKVATVNSNWSPSPNTTSVYRIYNDIWKVGTVATQFNTDLRAHNFDFVNGLDALQQVKDKYFDSNDEVGYLTYTSSFNGTSGRWENYVNLTGIKVYGGVTFRYQKNIKSLTRRKESQEMYTRIIPTGINNLTVGSVATTNRTDSFITYPTHISGYNYVDNFQYFLEQGYTYKQCLDNHVKIYRFNDARYTTASGLYADSVKMLEKMSTPKYTYVVSILDLSTITGMEYESFQIGDTIRIVDNEYNIDLYATISMIDRNQDEPQNASVEITNIVSRMSDIIKRIVNRGDEYAGLKAKYGNTATYIIGDRLTSKNWRQADYVVQPFESASSVIQKVIDETSLIGGGIVVLLDGSFAITSTINMKNNVSIVGSGNGTRLFPSGSNVSTCISAVGQNNIAIRSMFIDYVENPSAPLVPINYFLNGISISGGCDNVTVEYMYTEYLDNNMFIAQSSSNIFVNNNIYTNKTVRYIGTDVIDLKDCTNARVLDNTINIFGAPLRTFIGIDTVGTGGSGEFLISGNNIYQHSTSPESSFYACIDVLTNGKVVISNNIINLTNYKTQVIQIRRALDGCSILNNDITHVVADDPSITILYPVTVVIDGNTVRVSGWTNVVNMVISFEGLNSFITNNKVYKISGTYDYALYLWSTATNTTVSNNVLNSSWSISAYADVGSGTQILGGNRLT